MAESKSAEKVAILVDDEILSNEIQDSLEALGYAVVKTAAWGPDAFDASVNVVLVDLDLKGPVDAMELGNAIERTGRAWVIYLADDDAQADRVKNEARDSGWVEWPFHPIELDFEVQIALQKRDEKHRLELEGAGVPQ